MFKEQFKFYKRKNVLPDLSNVIDVTNPDQNQLRAIKGYNLPPEIEKYLEKLGLKPIDEWNIFNIETVPGLLLIANPFSPIGQRIWMYRCLAKYPQPPNKLNLHARNELLKTEDWWQICQNNQFRKHKLYNKLRWTTLGYHHNWDTKHYCEEDRNEFPEDLALLCRVISLFSCNYEFTAQAAIINYYYFDSTLAGHTDHSEPNCHAPLFSFSFGQNAIFLIGGQNLKDPTKAIVVRSGDIIVMSGTSRSCYHGVPKVFPIQTGDESWQIENEQNNCYSSKDNDLILCTNDDFWKPFDNYVKQARININVRQVLFPDQTKLP